MAVMALGCCQLAIKQAQEIALASSMQLGLPLAFGLKPTHSPIVWAGGCFVWPIGIGQIGGAKDIFNLFP